jgi:hypothetical protein
VPRVVGKLPWPLFLKKRGIKDSLSLSLFQKKRGTEIHSQHLPSLPKRGRGSFLATSLLPE